MSSSTFEVICQERRFDLARGDIGEKAYRCTISSQDGALIHKVEIPYHNSTQGVSPSSSMVQMTMFLPPTSVNEGYSGPELAHQLFNASNSHGWESYSTSSGSAGILTPATSIASGYESDDDKSGWNPDRDTRLDWKENNGWAPWLYPNDNDDAGSSGATDENDNDDAVSADNYDAEDSSGTQHDNNDDNAWGAGNHDDEDSWGDEYPDHQDICTVEDSSDANSYAGQYTDDEIHGTGSADEVDTWGANDPNNDASWAALDNSNGYQYSAEYTVDHDNDNDWLDDEWNRPYWKTRDDAWVPEPAWSREWNYPKDEIVDHNEGSYAAEQSQHEQSYGTEYAEDDDNATAIDDTTAWWYPSDQTTNITDFVQATEHRPCDNAMNTARWVSNDNPTEWETQEWNAHGNANDVHEATAMQEDDGWGENDNRTNEDNSGW